MSLSGTDEILVICGVFFLALGVALTLSREAHYIGLVDVPNERSSHSMPTPRGGGLGIFISVTLGVWFWAIAVHIDVVWKNMLIAAAAVAAIGLWDDVRSVPARLRFFVHVLAAAYLVSAFPMDSKIQFVNGISIRGWPALALSCAGIVSLINVFNFMDGIDGLAASEAVFVAGGGALTMLFAGHAHSPVVFVCVMIAAASSGFLLMNWAPARIFLGDVGSGFLGFMIATVVAWSMFDQWMSIWTWLILGGVFLADATVTFFRRLSRGENVTSAHRMHGYQRLTRLWSSHSRVTLLAIAINCFWLFPLALMSTARPAYAPMLAGIAVVPIGTALWLFGAGQPD